MHFVRCQHRWAAVALLLVGGSARAQYSNRSIGLSAGMAKPDGVGLDWALPVGLVYVQYLEGNLDLVLHAQAALVSEQPQGKQGFAIAPSIGLRYRFDAEAFRPFVGIDLQSLHVFNDALAEVDNHVGLGPNLGLEYFPADSWSIGVRAQWTIYWWLGATALQTSLGGTLEANFYY